MEDIIISTPAGNLWVEQKLFFTVIDELQALVFFHWLHCLVWIGDFFVIVDLSTRISLNQKLDSDIQLVFMHSIKLQ